MPISEHSTRVTSKPDPTSGDEVALAWTRGNNSLYGSFCWNPVNHTPDAQVMLDPGGREDNAHLAVDVEVQSGIPPGKMANPTIKIDTPS